MPGQCCCVTNCPNRSHDAKGNKNNNGIRYFRFPTWKRREGQHVADLTRKRRMAWIAAVRRKDATFDNIPNSLRVCSQHFHSGNPSFLMLENHPDWYPSLLLGHNDVKATNPGRFQRHAKRKMGPNWHAEAERMRALGITVNVELQPSPIQNTDPPHLQDVEPKLSDEECSRCQSGQDLILRLMEENKQLKEELEILRMNVQFLRGDDAKVQHYTDITVSCF